MTIETREDLEGMARVGKVVSLALNEMTNRAGGLAPTPRLLAILSAVGLLLILGGGYVSRVRRPWAAPWPQRDVIGVPPRLTARDIEPIIGLFQQGRSTTVTPSPLTSRRLSFDGPTEALDAFLDRGWTVGLPIVSPMPERVGLFLEHVGRSPSEILGNEPLRRASFFGKYR